MSSYTRRHILLRIIVVILRLDRRIRFFYQKDPVIKHALDPGSWSRTGSDPGSQDDLQGRFLVLNRISNYFRNKDVNTWLYWDGGHGADEDPEDFIAWIGNITGFTE